MWKGRFQKETSDLVKRYGESVSFDWRLYAQDIRGSMAQADGLLRAGILTTAECRQIKSGLREIEKEIQDGRFTWKFSLEDVHMNIESALTERIGAAGAKLHTARSRNDQVATDARLYCRDEGAVMSGLMRDLQRALVRSAAAHVEVILPGYTHLQRAQPVLATHYFGSGALAGSTIVLDREYVAAQLGFDGVTRNSMDAVSDRDFMAELLFVIALCGVHLSRLAEDIILWASAEFAFITLDDAHTTGSSLMPQKKNPDVAELTRGKCGRLIGNLVSLLTTLKGLPMTYNRDLQEDKERLFDSIDTLKMALAVNAEMITAMQVNGSVCRAAASDPFLLATDLADYLVKKGLPFRHAHEVIGKLTAFSLTEKRGFPDMTLEEFRQFSDEFSDDVFAVLNLETALAARQAPGAPSPVGVAAEIKRWQKSLGKPARKR